MTTRVPYLTIRFGGYFHRDIPQEDAERTPVGPGTPGDEYFCRSWQPMCFADELHDRIADGSIMPRVTTGNSMVPCTIIGARAA